MTINEIQNSIVHEMSDLNDWLDKYDIKYAIFCF